MTPPNHHLSIERQLTDLAGRVVTPDDADYDDTRRRGGRR